MKHNEQPVINNYDMGRLSDESFKYWFRTTSCKKSVRDEHGVI